MTRWVRWKAFWILNKLTILCLILAALTALWSVSSSAAAGKGGMTDKRYEKQERHLQKHWKNLEEEEAKEDGTYYGLKRGVRLVSEEEVRTYARLYLDGYTDWLIWTCGHCESGGNSFAKSSPNGTYKGYCQFYLPTFLAWGGEDIWDWRDQVRTVGRHIKQYGFEETRKHFPYCGYR